MGAGARGPDSGTSLDSATPLDSAPLLDSGTLLGSAALLDSALFTPEREQLPTAALRRACARWPQP